VYGRSEGQSEVERSVGRVSRVASVKDRGNQKGPEVVSTVWKSEGRRQQCLHAAGRVEE
jgi:hypothetical protein